MTSRNYWLDLFTAKTWQQFLDAGGVVSGFRASKWVTVQKIQKGDYLLCYLTGVSRFIGILEVVSDPYQDSTPIWNDDVFPSRIRVQVVVALTPETAVPIRELDSEISIFKNLSSPGAWTGFLRASPARWKLEDGEAITRALFNAKAQPIERPVDARKLQRRPPILARKKGLSSAPKDKEQPQPTDVTVVVEPSESLNEVRKHTEIQYLLLKLGNGMGFNIWVARNDKNREIGGKRFSEIFSLRDNLPLQFDIETTRIIENIDVLWLTGNRIIAAFEIESTTSIYSGLLRMSDLLAMQPNINIPLYIVAPEERRAKVTSEVNRPTFNRLSPPLHEACRYISFLTLQKKVDELASLVRYLRPEFLNEISESCKTASN